MTKLTHLAALPVEQLLEQCELQTTRGSGPGGQHRNKVETAVVITHKETGTSGQASERRSQLENRAIAVHRLRLNLAIQWRSPWSKVSGGKQTVERTTPRLFSSGIDSKEVDGAFHEMRTSIEPDSKPDVALPPEREQPWTSRLVRGRLVVSEQHEDFPAVLADLLDHLCWAGWDINSVAQSAGTTSSQLMNLLRKHSPALQFLNSQRTQLGLHPLR